MVLFAESSSEHPYRIGRDVMVESQDGGASDLSPVTKNVAESQVADSRSLLQVREYHHPGPGYSLQALIEARRHLSPEPLPQGETAART